MRVEVITYAPTIFTHCQHCEVAFGRAGLADRIHREQAQESLPEDLQREFAEVAGWVHSLWTRHGDRISVSVVDAASMQGVWKSFRHGTRKYPAVVIDGEERFVGSDLAPAEIEIERRLAPDAG